MIPMSLAIFDLDNTLVDRTAAFTAWSERFVAEHHLDPANALPFFAAADDGGERPRHEFFAAIREEFRLGEAVSRLVAAWWPAYLESYRCTDDTIDALRLLRGHGWKVGIATNGDARQNEKIGRAGLDRLVDACCVSELVGCAKPDPRMLRLVADGCAVDLKGAWMIGDSGAADIAGAVAAGIPSVWLARGRAWVEQDYRPTVIASSVSQAVAAILSAD